MKLPRFAVLLTVVLAAFLAQSALAAVTLTLYVHNGSPSGPIISGASVSGTDGLGLSFNVATGSAGYVMITGNPGTWNFHLSASGYNNNDYSQSITSTGQKDAYLTPSTSSVTLTLYVHNGSPTGPIISDASVTGSDANGVSFSKTTNSSGYVTITGVPGTWSFNLSASGYTNNNYSQSITATGQKDAYLTPSTSSVTLTLYVHNGSPSGPTISAAAVTGSDANGAGFSKTTNSSGYVTITGAPGTWSFNLSASGYTNNNYSQSITTTGQKDAYLTPSTSSVTLTLYVHNGSPSGSIISGATVTGSDANGVSFSKSTNSSGYVTITAAPGTWSFNLSASGYTNNNYSQSITTTGQKDAYLTPSTSSVTLTLYVHNGSPSGSIISGATVTGNDAAGISFSKTTNSSGYVTITGSPGTWQFTASAPGYNPTTWGQTIASNGQRDAFLTPTASNTAVLPTVQTISANVSQSSVVINGTITSTGGSVVDDRRFDWGSTQPLGNAVFASSIAVNGNNFSATLSGLSPNTLYYFRAWAHNGSTANAGYGVGWNTGVVLSFTTGTSPGVAPPAITTQPADGIISANGSLTLSVSASGSDLRYRWFRDGTAILGATSSAVSVNLPAAYWVVVSNSGGQVTSRHAVVIAETALPPPPSGQPQPGAATWTGRIDPSLPTIVITHGWQPGIDYNGAPPEWVSQMGLELFNRFERANYPPRVNGQRSNIVFFTWPEAYTLLLPSAATHTQAEGLRLASELRRILGSQYSGHMHFIGHSLGTLVNAYAAEDYSRLGVTQFTILDAPLKFMPYSSLFFEEHLNQLEISWVDNYIATDHSLPTPGVGDVIPGSAPNGGLKENTDHVGIHDFYLGTITNDSSTLGFFNSVVLDLPAGWESRPLPRDWRPNFSADDVDIIIDMGAHLPEIAAEGFHLLQGTVQQASDNIRGAARESIHMITGFFGGSSALNMQLQKSYATELLTAQLDSNDASIAMDVTVPAATDTLTFDYRFPTINAGDWMTVTFNTTLLYSFPADSTAQGDFRSAEVPVASIAGQTGVLMLTLHSTSTGQTELAVSNFQFSAPKARIPKFANIATRLSIGTGDNALIGGFIITGTQPKTVVVRGIGPSLGALGVPGVLSDPIIEVHDSSGAVIPGGSNDNWRDSLTSQQIAASGLAPTNDLESAFWGTLNPGAYTVVVRGKGGGAGNGLFEVYDLNQMADSKLGNISTRGFVSTGDNVMIGGTIIVGDAPSKILLRAIGPSLTNFGVSNALSDPVLELHDGNGGLMSSNDNWRDTQQAEIASTNLSPTDDRESAILAILDPGQYTAVVRGKGDATGVAIVEAYQLATPTPTPSPTPTPNPTPVIVFSDNFDGNSLDSSKWTVENSGSATVANGVVSIAAGGGNWSGTISTIGKMMLSGQSYTVEFRARRTADYDLNFNLTDGTNTLNVMESSYSLNLGFRLNTSGAFGISNQGNGNQTTDWKEYRITVSGNTVTAQRGDSLSNLTETLTQTLADSVANHPLFLRFGNAGPNTVEIDWVRVTSQ